MVGGVLINWSAIFDAIDLVLEILDFSPGLVTALQVARAIAHSMGQQLHAPCGVQRVLQLRLKVRQVGGGQVFDSHAATPNQSLTASVDQANLPHILKGRRPSGAES
jgi:hypothetical protein